MKYVKKPVIIEAFQFGHEDYPEWFLNSLSTKVSFHSDYPNCCKIISSSGVMDAWTGDMIIKDIQGDIYPCKKDKFDSTYETMGE